MIDFSKMVRAAVRRREALQKQILKARDVVLECEKEMDRIVRVLDALGNGRRSRTSPRARKGGRWRPGRPGRPPNWWREQQKAKGAKGGAKRRGRRRGRRAAAAPPAAST